MNHRQRVLTTLRHQEPDRVPIDLGGTADSTIIAMAYQDFRKELGLSPTTTRVVDVAQQTAVIEGDVRQALDVDVRPVFDEPKEWRTGSLGDGSAAELPARFEPFRQVDGFTYCCFLAVRHSRFRAREIKDNRLGVSTCKRSGFV